jgi:asparagine synthase (glutamine-hydrolysing)
MCGICGVLQRDGESVCEQLIVEMNQRIQHRGPDDSGVYVKENIGIGNTRLAIIDVDQGRQPISSSDDRYWIVYNGEVYNFIELRLELEAAGLAFLTDSDTEVVLKSFIHWGAGAFERFNGMFALAIWDNRDRELVLARDRFGIKPLYLAAANGRLAFASEIKALIPVDWWDRQLDPLALDEYFSYLCIPEPRTIYRGIRTLEAGHWASVKKGELSVRRYWDCVYSPQPMTMDDAVTGLDAALTQAVKLSMRSDVPVGAFLSGGLDSGGVVAYAAESAPGKLSTFTVGFATDPSYDESREAEMVAARWGTDHHTLQLESNSGDVPRLANAAIRAMDQPYADFSILPQLQIAEFAANHVKTVLSGDGGDEILGGYPTVYMPYYAEMYRKVPSWLRRRLIGPLVRAWPTSTNRISADYVAKRFVRGAELPVDRAHFAYKEATFSEDKPFLYAEGFRNQVGDHDAFAPLALAGKGLDGLDTEHRLMRMDQKTFLLNDNLPKVDRASMRASLEVRLPLLNNAVVDFLLTVPAELKIKPLKTKRCFRKLLTEKLPGCVTGSRKKGFSPPAAAWFRDDLYGWARDTIESQAARNLGIVSTSSAVEFLDRHREGRGDYHRLLYCCIMLGLWAETKSDG